MTSNDVNLSIKLWLDVGNNEYIILCYFGVRIMSGLEVIEGGGGGIYTCQKSTSREFQSERSELFRP